MWHYLSKRKVLGRKENNKKITPIAVKLIGEKPWIGRMNNTSRRRKASISLYKNGMISNAPSIRLPPSKRGEKRGSIKEWSAKSRLRLRRTLMTLIPVAEHYNEANITLTVPGPPLSIPEMKKLWKDFCRDYQKTGYSAVWRLEVQKRGSVHWHMVATIPSKNVNPARMPELALTFFKIQQLWFKSIKKLGPCVHECKLSGHQGTWEFQNRMDIPGAEKYSINIQFDEQNEGDRWAWRRYMQDHASKGKQEQIAVGFGRHWSVIGKSGYRYDMPSLERLPDHEYFRVIRWMQKMCSGTVRADLAPFGRKRGKRQRRGTHGSSVWFSNSVTASRLIDLAQSLSRPG